MGIVSADFGGRRLRRRVLRWGLATLLVVILFWWLPRLLHLYTEWLWFQHDVRFPRVFWAILTTKIGLAVVFGLAFLVLVLGNVELARRLARRTLWYDEERALRQRLAEVMEYFVARYLYVVAILLAVVVAYGVALGAADQWHKYLLFRNGLSFGVSDPVFRLDVGFYVFRLPFWRYLWQWCYYVLITTFIVSALVHYFDKAIRVLRGVPAFAPHVKSHLSVLLGAILAVKAIDYWLDRYDLLYSPRGATFGASYTDVHAQLLACNVLLVIALACAVLVLVNIHFRGLWLPLAGIGFLFISSLLISSAYPRIVERFHVEPNQFEREKQYIAHTIAYTRQGFGLDRIEQQQFGRMGPLSADAVRRNVATIENVRLWDYRPLLDTYQQQQALWPYYRFNSVDIDRYMLDGQYRQVMLAARELWAPGLPEKGWQNEHVFNTHGYGVVMSPVTDVIQSGLPNLVVQNIPPESSSGPTVTRPGIYYGELTSDYVIVGTREDENDYPLPATNETAKTRYSGRGGVPIGSALARLATAVRFKDINIVISTIIKSESRLLWGRTVRDRVMHIAPFLSYDQDPYIVVGDDGHLYWIMDAYTTSEMYPYSEPVQTRGRRFNYIRNSVKVVVDAYDGTVVFYVAEPEDPMILTYQRIFPDLFRQMADMPAGLLSHIRYPEALFNTQCERFTVYHMTDPLAFYNKIERWQVAREAHKSFGGSPSAASAAGGEGEVMQAYYAIMKLPGERDPEFLLMVPFNPFDKPNMVAWLAARCDRDDYGKLLMYNFPKNQQIWGPMQIEASINQDDTISAWITLRNQQGSQVMQGNLLVIPLERSVLYIEPLYMMAAQSRIPELKQVVVARGDGRVVMKPTLSQALTGLLGEPAPKLAALEPTRAEPAAPEVEEPEPRAAPEPGVAPPTAPPSGAHALAVEADRHFRDALARQQEGDWAGYGESLDRLRSTLEKLVAQTQP